MKKTLFLTIFILTIFMMVNPVYAMNTHNDNSTGGIKDDQVGSLAGNQETIIEGNNFICEIFGEDVQFDKQLPKIIGLVITVMQIMAPVLLVIFGLIDVVKGITAQKEDEIKKGQQIFIKRAIAAVLVFFVIAIVKFGISLFAKNSSGGLMSCVECFIKEPEGNKC